MGYDGSQGHRWGLEVSDMPPTLLSHCTGPMGQMIWNFIIKPSPADLGSSQNDLQGNFTYIQIGSYTQLVSGGSLDLQSF